MTTATIAIRAQKNLQKTIDAAEIPSVNWKYICFAGFFISIFLLIFYVLQINALTAGTYSTGNLQKQIAKLSSENKELQVVFAENSFLGQAIEKVQAMNFDKAVSVKYVQVPENYTALAKK